MPVIVTGGMDGADHVRWVFEYTGCEAVMLARGSLGNPWLFAQVLGARDDAPAREEIIEEWEWVVDRAEEHLGADGPLATCASSIPGTPNGCALDAPCRTRLQRADTLSEQRAIIADLGATMLGRASV